MSTIVRLGPEYIPDPTKGKPIANGSIYIGEPDLDPEIELNQIQVNAQQEDGDLVPISQPIETGAGGVPLLDGSPVTLFVDEAYSLKVLDSLGVQVYYVPTNFAQNVSALVFLSDYGCDLAAAITDIGSTETTLMIDCDAVISEGVTVTVLETTTLDFIRGGSVDGVSGGGTETLSYETDPIAGLYRTYGENLVVTGLKNSYVEWFGAIGDGTTGDGAAANAAVNSLTSGGNLFFQAKTYLLDEAFNPSTSGNTNINIVGSGFGTILKKDISLQDVHFVSIGDGSNLRNLYIDGNYSAMTPSGNTTQGHCIYITGSNIIVSDVFAVDSDASCLVGNGDLFTIGNVEINNFTGSTWIDHGIYFSGASSNIRGNNIDLRSSTGSRALKFRDGPEDVFIDGAIIKVTGTGAGALEVGNRAAACSNINFTNVNAETREIGLYVRNNEAFICDSITLSNSIFTHTGTLTRTAIATENDATRGVTVLRVSDTEFNDFERFSFQGASDNSVPLGSSRLYLDDVVFKGKSDDAAGSLFGGFQDVYIDDCYFQGASTGTDNFSLNTVINMRIKGSSFRNYTNIFRANSDFLTGGDIIFKKNDLRSVGALINTPLSDGETKYRFYDYDNYGDVSANTLHADYVDNIISFNGVSGNSDHNFTKQFDDHANGFLKIFTHQDDAIADDGLINLPVGAGMVMVSCNAEGGLWLIEADGATTKISGTTNTAATDSDTDLCVFDAGSFGRVKNRLGVIGVIRIIFFYN